MQGSSIKLTLRLPQTMHERLRKRAQESHRSLNAVILETLRDGLETPPSVIYSERQQALKLLHDSGLIEELDPAWQKYAAQAAQISHAELRQRLKDTPSLSEIIIAERGPRE